MFVPMILLGLFAGPVQAEGAILETLPELKDATGICYRKMYSASVERYEFVIVHQSSDLRNDIVRINGLEGSPDLPVKHPHTIPFVWHSAWMTDDFIDFTTGPSCEGLPKMKAP